MKNPHELLEKNVGLLTVLILVAISFGAMAQILPLMFDQQALEPNWPQKPQDNREIFQECLNVINSVWPALI